MTDYISREAAIEILAEYFNSLQDFVGANTPRKNAIAECIERLKSIPDADVVEVRHGRWVSIAADVCFRCSLCDCEVSTSWDYDQDGMFDYCPCCGAKMDGGDRDD